jgi:phage portal protein BeeE
MARATTGKAAKPAGARSRKAQRVQVHVVKAIETDGASIESLSGFSSSEGNRVPEADVYWMLFTKHPWIKMCVQFIANTVCNDGFVIQPAQDEQKKPLSANDDSRVGDIHTFFRNAIISDTWRNGTLSAAIDLLVFGGGYWLKKRANGLLVGLERLDPRVTKPKPNKDRTEIECFLVKRIIDSGITGVAPFMTCTDRIDPADVVFFKWGGGDPLLGLPSPLESLDLTLALDLAIRRHREAFFRNGAVAGTILTNETAVEEEVRDAERMFKRTKAGSENAYRPWLLTGDWKLVSGAAAESGKNDFDFVRGSGINREDVCGVYHVPPGKLFFTGSALGQAGKAEDDATFQEQCVLPLEETIYEILTREILLKEFDIEDLEMAPKRRHSLRLDMFDAAETLTKFGGTGNEARQLVNLPKIEDDRFDMDAPLFANHSAATVGDDEALQPGTSPADQQGSSGASAEGSQGEQDDAQKKKAARSFPNRHVWTKKAQRLVGRIHANLNAVVLPALRSNKAEPLVDTGAFVQQPIDWIATWDRVLGVISDGYDEARALGEKTVEAYSFNVSAPGHKRIDNAVNAALDKAEGFVRNNLAPYIEGLAQSDKDPDDIEELASRRLEMYAEPAWNVFQRTKSEGFDDQQGLELDWELDPSSEHCDDCPDIAQESPFSTQDGDHPLPTWPGDGETQCKARCNCDVTPEEKSWERVTSALDQELEGINNDVQESFT